MRKVKKKKKQILSMKTKLIVLGVIIVAFLIWGFFESPWGKQVISFGRETCSSFHEKAHLVLDQVLVSGHARTRQSDINQALNLTQGMPIMQIDLQKAHDRLAALPWVKAVSIERHLPSTLSIRIQEKKPIAVWKLKQKSIPLDEMGQEIKDPKTIFENLLCVVGRDAPEHTPDLIQILEKYPEISTKVRAAIRIGGRRWNLVLNDLQNGTSIYLPEKDISEALQRLQQLNQESQILKRDLKIIDLRLSDRLIVQTQKGGLL